jgi:hypothetical protein
MRRAAPAFDAQPSRPDAIGAGPAGRDRARAATQRILTPLTVGAPQHGTEPPPEMIVEATGGGIWTVIQQEVTHGRAEALPALAPASADFALRPSGVEPGHSADSKDVPSAMRQTDPSGAADRGPARVTTELLGDLRQFVQMFEVPRARVFRAGDLDNWFFTECVHRRA